MIVTCKNCSTSYKLSKNKLKKNQYILKCGHCLNEWSVLDQKKPLLLDRSYRPSKKPGPLRALFPSQSYPKSIQIASYSMYACCLGLVLLLPVLLTSAYFFRYELIRFLPGTIRLYQGLNIPLYQSGLKLSNIEIIPVFKTDNIETLLIKGQITNKTKHQVNLPSLSIEIFKVLDASSNTKLTNQILKQSMEKERIKTESYLQTIMALKKQYINPGKTLYFAYQLNKTYSEETKSEHVNFIDFSDQTETFHKMVESAESTIMRLTFPEYTASKNIPIELTHSINASKRIFFLKEHNTSHSFHSLNAFIGVLTFKQSAAKEIILKS